MRELATSRQQRGDLMRVAALVLAIVAALACISIAGASDSSAPLSGEWHRLSVDRSHPAPEHELLRCVRNNGTTDPWLCRYRKAPEPTLNLTWNNNFGVMSGRDITSSWTCPAWFPAGICANVVSVVEGTMNFTDPNTHQPPLSVLTDLVVVQTGAGQRLYDYWVNRFVCPWFRSFDEAIAANPITLPFDGNFPPQDCVVAR
jgi:hypothetical protein